MLVLVDNCCKHLHGIEVQNCYVGEVVARWRPYITLTQRYSAFTWVFYV